MKEQVEGDCYMRKLCKTLILVAVFAAVLVGCATPKVPTSTDTDEIITLGRYEQDNNTENGAEPIEWVVLHKDGESKILLSKKVLDVGPYNDTADFGCSLFDWLNTDFYQAAFDAAEQNMVSGVGVFEPGFVRKYSIEKSALATSLTAFALSKNPRMGGSGDYLWWVFGSRLSKTDDSVTGQILARANQKGEIAVNAHGEEMFVFGNVIEPQGIRPVIWLNTDEANIQKAPAYKIVETESGSGNSSSPSRPCAVCGGSGTVRYYYGNASWEYTIGPCPSCK